jgi:acyl carrier protein phosphodiesterase
LNYLAHIFLSGTNAGMQTGGFIADFVKGKKFDLYPDNIRSGILLHRLIDEFTDNHHIVKEVKQLLRPTFGRYSGIIADMYFDHFLAVHFHRYSQVSLERFAPKFYFSAVIRYWHLPPKVKRFIFHFISTNRLKKYRTVTGLKDSLLIMATYKISALKPDEIVFFLEENYGVLEMYFHRFFRELVVFAGVNRSQLIQP